MNLLSADQRGLLSFAGFCVRRRGAGSLAVEIDEPQVGAALVGVEVRFRLIDVRDVAAVGRDLRIADALHAHEIVRRERCLVRTGPD